MSRIVLASGSPRRQELLNRIGITDFDIRVPQTDEHYPTGLTPAQIVEYISREKADAAAKLCTPEEAAGILNGETARRNSAAIIKEN